MRKLCRRHGTTFDGGNSKGRTIETDAESNFEIKIFAFGASSVDLRSLKLLRKRESLLSEAVDELGVDSFRAALALFARESVLAQCVAEAVVVRDAKRGQPQGIVARNAATDVAPLGRLALVVFVASGRGAVDLDVDVREADVRPAAGSHQRSRGSSGGLGVGERRARRERDECKEHEPHGGATGHGEVSWRGGRRKWEGLTPERRRRVRQEARVWK